jgi:hypothetical protein
MPQTILDIPSKREGIRYLHYVYVSTLIFGALHAREWWIKAFENLGRSQAVARRRLAFRLRRLYMASQ